MHMLQVTIGCLQLGVSSNNGANLFSQQSLQEASEAKMATITVT